jgi:cysteinyl-tRNA synthetase
MSKSEGTAYALAEVRKEGFDPLALRYLFLQAHYRSKQNFTWEALTAAQTALDKIRAYIAEWKGEEGGGDASPHEPSRKQFIEALEDDCNTPQALAVVWEVIKNDTILNTEKLATVLDCDHVLGLDLATITADVNDIPEDIQALIDNRDKFRALGDFEAADETRQKIEDAGYAVTDAPAGTLVKKK